MASETERVGQALLNVELTNGLTAKDAELHAYRIAAIHSAPRRSSSDSATVAGLKSRIKFQDDLLAQYFQADEKWKGALNEWMVTHGAFKRLAWEYARRLGVEEDELTRSFRQHLVDIAAEDPNLAATSAAANAAAALASQPAS